MKIKPLPNRIYIKINVVTAGVLDTESINLFDEVAEVISVGSDVKDVKPGDKILFEQYGLCISRIDGKKHFFIDQESGCINAILC